MLFLLITIFSLLIAAAFAAIAWRVLSEERKRSDARVAALGAAMDGIAILKDGRAPSPPVAPDEPSALFETSHRSAVQGAPLAKVAAAAAMAIVVIVAIAMSAGHPRTPRSTATAASADDVAGAAAAPLELVSMTHQKTGDAFTVTGLVRNATTTPTTGLIAVVFAFDRNGNFVSSARAPVDFVTLGPGDESPFRVTVPNAGDVGRYRVSFRNEAGVVRHLDRRGSAQASAKPPLRGAAAGTPE